MTSEGNTEEMKEVMPDPLAVSRKKYKIPQLPHMQQAQIDALEDIFKTTNCFLEYGAGGSTMLAARSNVADIVSVESDAIFARSVVRAFRRIESPSKLTMSVVKIGETGRWGMPVNRDMSNKWPEYSLDIWDVMDEKGLSPDVVLIDGRFRISCLLASMIRAKPGTILLFDDYTRVKRRYHQVESIIKPREIIGLMAIFETPEKYDHVKVALELARRVVDPG